MPCLYLALLLACVTAAQSIETGLTELPSNADTRCSEPILTYTCYTAGRGATEVTLDNETVQGLQFSHSRYADGSNVNQSGPDNNINAGNLSISQDEECSDELANGSASFCFKTVINVHLTDQTRCQMIGCRTTLRTDGVDKFVYYGNATIARQPPAPRNLRNTTESDGAVTFTWDPGSTSCSNARYSVSTSNCGSCGDRNISTPYTNITCSELVPKQQCRIAVQSVLECGVPSEAEILVIEAAAVSTVKPATGETVNVGAIVGGVLSGLALIIIIASALIVGIICLKRKRRSIIFHKRSDVRSEAARKGTETSHEGDKQEGEEEIQRSQEEPPSNKMNETTVTVEDPTIETNPDQRLLSSPPNKSTPTEKPTEALHLHQISSGSNSTAADGDQNASIEAESYLQNNDTKVYTPQSSEESRVEVAEESSGDDVNLKSGIANFVAISQTKPVHSGMQSPRIHVLAAVDEESFPTTATSRGVEPLQIGLRSTFESFSGPMGGDRELEEASETTVAETVCSQDPPKKSYGLSKQGMLLSQATFDEDKEPNTPVPSTDSEVNSPKFAGITQYSNVAGSSQMADFGRRLEQLECGKEEQEKKIEELKTDREEQKKEIEEQKEKIHELKTSQEEHKCQMEKSQLKIDELEAKARKSDLKVESLLSKVEQLSKDLQKMEKRNAELIEANITEKAKHQEEVEKLQQKHQEETETLKQEMEAVKTELEDERTKSRLLKEELERERKKVVNFEKMMKSHEASSLGQLGSGTPKYLSLHSCPA